MDIDLGDITVHVRDTGSGTPVVLLHGWPDTGDLWRHQVPALTASGYRVIAPDLRGFGRSDRPEAVEAYRIRSLVGDVLGVLDAVGAGRAAVVGHDWGASLAWATAMGAPDRVARLVPISVGHPGSNAFAGLRQRQLSWYMLWFIAPGVAERVLPADDWAWYREWAWQGKSRDDDPDLRRQLGDLERPGALTAGLNWYRANILPERYVLSPADVAGMATVSCPTMAVWSTGDMALGEEQMLVSERFVTGPWRYERIEDAGHWIPTEAPERLSELLLDFLAD
jgi:pimeloyl-ACP methyl ester carboxylesterase